MEARKTDNSTAPPTQVEATSWTMVAVPSSSETHNLAGQDAEKQSTVTKREDSQPMSKKAMKGKFKLEKLKDYRIKRKADEKELKRAKAVAEGRNLEEERRKLEERTRLGGEGRKRREEMWDEKFKGVDCTFGICIDCAYDYQMTDKEINSLAQQIRYCYAQNKRSSNPCRYLVSNLTGKTLENLKKESGFPDNWKARGFKCSEISLEDMIPDKSRLVYLTSDSENELQHLSDDKIYVIGGIVDRNRLKRTAITRAENLGLQTAKLPIDQYIKLSATKVLTCNHVFQILLKYREHGNDWKKAMMEILPQRKNIEEIDGASDSKQMNLAGNKESSKAEETLSLPFESTSKNASKSTKIFIKEKS